MRRTNEEEKIGLVKINILGIILNSYFNIKLSFFYELESINQNKLIYKLIIKFFFSNLLINLNPLAITVSRTLTKNSKLKCYLNFKFFT
ncbi:hypothetical protein BpHYR1_034580 [Brachionus plicatilis]|uniref:Uncharacterized protein n=1 Tax=Brachionus plicatilis TaxID=10195 RepID=A0A3M7R8R9_BRAPC|nr:hypothetical protein BpHYR1_034580 [Brachionus plicatilis]